MHVISLQYSESRLAAVSCPPPPKTSIQRPIYKRAARPKKKDPTTPAAGTTYTSATFEVEVAAALASEVASETALEASDWAELAAYRVEVSGMNFMIDMLRLRPSV